MGQDVTKTKSNLDTLVKDLGKVPVPQYVQSDFNAIKIQVTGLRDYLDKAADSATVGKARAAFATDKPDFDKKKKTMVDNQNAVNNAQPAQVASLGNAIGKIGDVNKAVSKVVELLKGKPGKEAELSKAITNFATKLSLEVNKTDKPMKIDDKL